MRKNRGIFRVLAVLLLMLQLTGCTSFVGVEGLLSPPQLQGDQKEIYDALQKSISGEIQLLYPRKGEYKSAIIMLNIDEEESSEAIAFYKYTGTQSGSSVGMSIRLNVLDRRNDKWISVYDMGVEADEVEKVQLLTVNEQIYLTVGYNRTAVSEKLLEIYRFENNILSVMEEFSALNYEVCDLDEDGSDEIMRIVAVAQLDEDGETVQMYPESELVQVGEDGFTVSGSVKMYPLVTDYTAIHVGTLADGTAAIFLDGTVGSQLITEVLICTKSGKLKHLLYQGTEESMSQVAITQRPSGIYTTDVENDGSYEIPRILPAPGYEDKEKYEQLYFTLWYNYNATGSQRRFLSYVDYSLGYVFRMPSNWEERVTAERSAVDNEITFYEYDRLTGERGAAILSLRVMSRSDYLSQDVSGKYELLMTNGQLVFLYYGHNSMSKLSMDKVVAKDSLYLLN